MIRKIFAAANTPYGFKSMFGKLLQDKYVYCIKGGSGVGKSTLIKNVLNHVDKDESGYLVPCSSDPSSYDMLVLNNAKIAIVDGTSPHITDPIAYGVNGEIIDLGKYIVKSKIEDYKDIVINKTRQKSVLFNIMYSHLMSAKLSLDNIKNMYKDNVSDYGEVVQELIDTFIDGSKSLDTPLECYGEYFTESGYVYDRELIMNRVVAKINSPCLEFGCDILNQLSQYMQSMGIKHEKHFSARIDNSLVGIGLSNTVLTVGDVESDYQYNIDKFIDTDGLKKYILHLIEERSAYTGAIALAAEYYLEAKECHQAIEECCRNSMSFVKLDKDKEKIISAILD